MKLLLITTLMFALGSAAYAQTKSNPAPETDCKEQQTDGTKKAKSKKARGRARAASAATEAAACPQQPPDSAPNAVTTPSAALSAATVAPPVDKTQLNVTIYHDLGEESLGAAARKIRAKKAAEDASKAQ
jgi:hypothetical protein